MCNDIQDEPAENTRKETVAEILQELLDFINYETFRQGYELVKIKRKVKEMAKQNDITLEDFTCTR